MNRLLAVLPACCLALGALAARVPGAAVDTTRLVPIVLDVPTATARYTTELALSNRGATSVTATLRYHPSLGAPSGGETSLALTPGQQLVVRDTIALLREKGLSLPEGEAQAGTLEVVFAGAESEDVVAATARTTTAVPSPTGRAGLAYGALRGGSTTRLLVYGLRESPADRSNLALLSTGTEPVTVKVTLRSGTGDGAAFVLYEAKTLPAFGWLQVNGVLGSAGMTNGWAEVERVGGAGAFSAYGVVNDNVTNDGSFLPPVPEGRSGGRLTVPVIAETATILSELVLANRSASAATLTLSYVRSLTAPDGADGVATVTLAPREQRIFPDAYALLRAAGVATGAERAGHVGSLRITVSGAPIDQVFAAARTGFRGPEGGSFGLFTPAVTPAEEAGPEVALHGLSADAENRSNVALVHTGPDGSGSIALEVRTYDGENGGVEKGSALRQTLAPGQHTQFNSILGNAGIRSGWVRVRRVEGSAPWLAYGVVNDGGLPGERTGDGAYVAMDLPAPVPAPAGTIGPAGGTVTLAGVGTLVVPPGALTSPVALTLTRHTNVPLDPNLDPETLVDLAPAGVRFAYPVPLTLSFDPARGPSGFAAHQLGVQRFEDPAWVPSASATADATARVVGGEITGGGTYGVRRLPSTAPCTSAESRQYDFWLGNWGYSAQGAFPGSNVITRDEQGCVIEENFSQQVYRGRSVNVYDPVTAKWHQTYIDTEGNRMVLIGTYTGDRMLLYETPGRRHSWRPLDANRIRLAMEESSNGGATWVERFTAQYTRR